MRGAAMKWALRRTFDRRASIFRPLPDGTEQTMYENVPCALSRSARTSAPAVAAQGAAMAESCYALVLYTMPEVVLRLGDRIEVSDAGERVYHGRTSDSVRYASHCVTVVEIVEVTPEA